MVFSVRSGFYEKFLMSGNVFIMSGLFFYSHQSVLVSGLQGSLYVTAGEDGTVAVWKVDCVSI